MSLSNVVKILQITYNHWKFNLLYKTLAQI